MNILLVNFEQFISSALFNKGRRVVRGGYCFFSGSDAVYCSDFGCGFFISAAGSFLKRFFFRESSVQTIQAWKNRIKILTPRLTTLFCDVKIVSKYCGCIGKKVYCSRRIKKGLCYGDTCSCKLFNLASCNFSAEMIQNLQFVVSRKNIETVILMYTRERNG